MFIDQKILQPDTTRLWAIQPGECFRVTEAVPGFDPRSIYMMCGDYKNPRHTIIDVSCGHITELHKDIQVIPVKSRIVIEEI